MTAAGQSYDPYHLINDVTELLRSHGLNPEVAHGNAGEALGGAGMLLRALGVEPSWIRSTPTSTASTEAGPTVTTATPGEPSNASRIVVPPVTQRERAGHHWIDLAAASYCMATSKSLQALQSAYEVSPEQTRYDPQVRETVATLAEADARATDSLAGFARRIGLRV
ncbi:MAG: hypothetical protein GEU83_00075 [Pseudonocardiaceae bacterium]|nr:hypothetical protein [Pseudonocardiaceae bacterium]